LFDDDETLAEEWESAAAGITAVAEAGILPGRMAIVRYLGSTLAPYYRIVLDVLVEEEARLGLQLSTARITQEVSARLAVAVGGPIPVPPVATLLDRLYDWGNVDRIHNTQRKGNYQEYLKQDYLYQMTPAGTVVHRELSRIDQEIGSTGALQASMLPEVLQALRALIDALPLPRTSERDQAAYSAFSRVVNGFAQLSENAKLFVQGLNRSLRLDSAEKANAFLAYKEVVVDYLQVFSIGIAKFAANIAEAIEAAETAGVLDALPAIARVEAAPALGLTIEETAERDTTTMRNQWTGLRRWFFTDGDQQPVVRALENRSVDAISRIMTTVRQLNEERFRRVNRKADLVTMARWFSADHTDVVSLWRAGFGLYPARHFGAPHPAVTDLDIRPTTSWWDGVAVPISPRLRKHGPRANTGVAARLPDQRKAKEMLRARQRAQDAAIEDAARSLAGQSPCHLSDLTSLTSQEFEVLLRCLDVALGSRPHKDNSRRADTSDGLIAVTIRPPIPWRFATVVTPEGTITVADFHITIEVQMDAL
jgi:uncharacterized protein (TIGR02677 family)